MLILLGGDIGTLYAIDISMNKHNTYRIDSKGNKVYITNVVSMAYMANDSSRALRKLDGQSKQLETPKQSACNIRGKRVY